LILYDRLNIASAVNAVSLPLEKAKEGYENFDKRASVKYVLDPHGEIAKYHKQK